MSVHVPVSNIHGPAGTTTIGRGGSGASFGQSAGSDLRRLLRLAKRSLGVEYIEAAFGPPECIDTCWDEATHRNASVYCPIHDNVMRRGSPIVAKGGSGTDPGSALTDRFPAAVDLVAVPILMADVVAVGSLTVIAETPRTFSSADITSLRDVAALIAQSLAGSEPFNKPAGNEPPGNDEKRFRILIENAAETFIIVDRNFRITYLGGRPFYAPMEAEGMPFSSLLFEEDRGTVLQALEKALRAPAQPISTVEFRVRRQDGVLRSYQCVINNQLNTEAVNGITINCLDITDSKAAEVRLVQAKEKAEEMSRLKTTFLTNLGHEIRTPLTGILGFAGILTGELDGKQQDFARMIEQSGTRLMNTLNSVLELARLETGGADVRNETLDIGREVAEIVKLMQPEAEAKSLYLQYVGSGGKTMARLNRTYLGRTLESLLSNAIRFTTEGGVTVTLTASQRNLEIAIRDTGTGISAKAQQRIFEDFMRETPAGNGVHEVRGMGLAIANRLVKLMDGEIALESEKGRGSTFTVRIPRFYAPDSEPGDTDTLEPRPAPARGRRILILDDSYMSRVLVQRILEPAYGVDMAGTAQEAIQRMCDNSYDLVLLDINLGTEKSGLDVLDELRTLPGYSKTPVAAVTAYALPSDRKRFLEGGFDHFLGKPYTKQELLDLVTRVLTPA